MQPIPKTRLALALAFALTACSLPMPKAPEPLPTGIGQQPVKGPSKNFSDGLLRSLDFDDALALSNDEAFAPLSSIAAARRQPRRDLGYLGMELLDGRGQVLSRSSKTFKPLARNLEYVSHVVLASETNGRLQESFISVYGIAEVVAWNSRKVEAGLLPTSKPDQLVILDGSIFPPSDQFVFSQQFASGGEARMACKLAADGSASALHSDLTGQAKSFECRADGSPVLAKYWFLVETQRYVVSEIQYQGQLQSRFRITAVGYRQ